VLPSGRESTVARIVTHDGDLPLAVAGQSVTLTLADEIDVSRGDLLAAIDALPEVADQFEANVVWMSDEPMLPGRPYLLKVGARTVGVSFAAPKYKVNVNTLEHLAAKTLELNEIGVCNLNLDRAIAFDAYDANRDTGGFIVIDRLSNATVGAGHAALRAAPLAQRALAGDRGRQKRPCSAQAAEGRGGVVHRAVGCGQVHRGQPGGEEAPRDGAPYLSCSTATTCATA
jgi:bifunctional enzyme CysN/CysC